MTNNQDLNRSNFDLEERTTEFAKRVIRLCRCLPKDSINNVLIDQIVRSAGSVGANYREANDSLGRKDFVHKLKISRKEVKETIHWLEIIEEANYKLKERMRLLKQEAVEIRNILSSIIIKMENKG